MLAATLRFKVKLAHADAFYTSEMSLYEICVNEAAFASHLRTPHFLAFDAETGTWCDSSVVETWERA